MYYYPLQAKLNNQAALRFYPPNADWKKFTNEVRSTYPNCDFRICFNGEDVKSNKDYLAALLANQRR